MKTGTVLQSDPSISLMSAHDLFFQTSRARSFQGNQKEVGAPKKNSQRRSHKIELLPFCVCCSVLTPLLVAYRSSPFYYTTATHTMAEVAQQFENPAAATMEEGAEEMEVRVGFAQLLFF